MIRLSAGENSRVVEPEMWDTSQRPRDETLAKSAQEKTKCI